MKRITYSTCTLTIAIVILLSSCKKNGGGGGNGNGGNTDVMYPATLSFYEGNNSGYPSNSTFKYDDKHHLTWFGNSSRWSTVAGSGIQQVILSGLDTLINANLFAGDILTGNGVNLIKTNYMWKYSTGNSLTGPVNTYYFANTDATGNFLGSYNDNTNTQFFTYDSKGNLTFSKFVTDAKGSPNSGNYDPGGLEFDRLTFKNYDDKPSPYSNIAGWRYISWQWAYPWQYYLSMSKHNPTQIIEESLNTTTMKWEVYSQSDLIYSYNDQGYPTRINITTKYPSTATPDKAFYQSYTFTYTK